MPNTVNIATNLLMKAAKFQQNHKIKSDVIKFDSDNEVIIFELYGEMTARVEYFQSQGQNRFWVKED